MTSSSFERSLIERATRSATRAVDEAVAERVNRLTVSPIPGVNLAETQGQTVGDSAITLTCVRLRQRYVSDAELRRLIRERLA